MTRHSSKALLLLVAVPLSVGFVAQLSPSEIAVETELPHPEEVRLMEELAAWTGESPTSSPSRPFPGSDGLTSSVQAYSESFSFFRQVAGPHGRSATLATLPFGPQIEQMSHRHRVDPLLVAAIVSAESSFDPHATSPVGAQGLMQLMPETAKYLSVTSGITPRGVDGSDPLDNLELGILYVRRLMKLYGDDVPLTLAAYNSGPGNVRKFGGIPPFSETQKYVEKVLVRYIDLQNAALTADRFLAADMVPGAVAGAS